MWNGCCANSQLIMTLEAGALQGVGSKKACFRLPVGGAPPQPPVGLRRGRVLPVCGAPPQLPVGLRPAPVLPVDDAPPQLPVGLRPARVFPVGDAPPQLSVELRPLPPPCCHSRIAHCFLLILLMVRLFPREQGRPAQLSNALWTPRARSR